ncbi:stage V sporulation protein AB [Pasteuria penetrans]|uniref:stage V sporulation protein AB n=1 Tax=Pasteuria penetrans TaxID=86005 RepID=UPI00165C736E|nr:stage V sporulation protein AB [Pasteuria penetrans]
MGSGFVALLSALQLFPRLLQLANVLQKSVFLEWALIAGVLSFTLVDLFDLHIGIHIVLLSIVGVGMGSFIGMLAGALTEVINVFPVFARRLRLQSYVTFIFSAVVVGKVTGSLCQMWWFPGVFYPSE